MDSALEGEGAYKDTIQNTKKHLGSKLVPAVLVMLHYILVHVDGQDSPFGSALTLARFSTLITQLQTEY